MGCRVPLGILGLQGLWSLTKEVPGSPRSPRAGRVEEQLRMGSCPRALGGSYGGKHPAGLGSRLAAGLLPVPPSISSENVREHFGGVTLHPILG